MLQSGFARPNKRLAMCKKELTEEDKAVIIEKFEKEIASNPMMKMLGRTGVNYKL